VAIDLLPLPTTVLSFLMDLVLHVDRHLAAFVTAYGPWAYGLLFAIVFAETGLVVTPFLPGDSLLFIVGALCAAGAMHLPVAAPALFLAAVAGDQCNYLLGRRFGPRIAGWRLVDRRALDRAHAFYERHGPVTVVLARFVPFIRTFAPLVAGIAQMQRPRFVAYNVAGGLLWVVSLLAAGLLFGNLPVIRDHLELIVWSLVLVPGLMALAGALRSRGPRPGAIGRTRP
jgi:membrane-associated protein